MEQASQRCPSCGANEFACLGRSCFTDWRESPEMDALKDADSRLYRCGRCLLIVRWPMPGESALRRAYETMPLAQWTYVEAPYWKLVRRILIRYSPNRRILDVGCIRGDFLAYLGVEWDRYGIEPSPGARAIASRRGVRIVGSDAFEELPEWATGFGAIVLMDVVEHVCNPEAVLNHLARYLAPNGVLVVLTGDSDHWLARRLLPFYWYMSFPIHLTYLSTKHMERFARQRGWAVVCQFRYAHKATGLYRRFRQVEFGIRMLAWRRVAASRHRRLAAVLARTRLFRRVSSAKTPPMLFGIKDHFCTVLRRATYAEPCAVVND